jgi:thioredoxin 1
MSQAMTITGADFEQEVLKSEIPVLLDFWAVWCQPCKMIAPHVDALAGEYAGRVKIGKVNVDEEGDLAQKYNVLSIPTLLFFKEGKLVDQVVGVRSKSEIAGKLESLL